MPTGIEWTEETWNPVRARLPDGKVGWHCTHASDGCKFCYAEAMNRRLGTGLEYKPGHESKIEVFLDPNALDKPLKWKRPRTIFPGSMTDLFADFVTDEMLDEIFARVAMTPHHTYQFLTKRPERMLDYFTTCPHRMRVHAWAKTCPGAGAFIKEQPWPLPNVWLGVSVEDERVKGRIDVLREIPAAIRWVSFEPLIGDPGPLDLTGIHWAVIGGESGSRARFRDGFELAAAHLLGKCQSQGVAVFFKQMVQKKLPIPDHLMIREMPS